MTTFSFRGPASDDWNPQGLNEDELEGKKDDATPPVSDDEDEEKDGAEAEKKEIDVSALEQAEADDLVALDLLDKEMAKEDRLNMDDLGDDAEEI